MEDDDYKVKRRISKIRDNNYQISHVNAKKYIKKTSILVPQYKHSDATKRILLLSDWVSLAETNVNEFLSPGYCGGIFTNILSYLESQDSVANFLCLPVNKDTDLKAIIEKVKPDHVLLCGFPLLTQFLPTKYSDVLSRLPGCLRGRIYQKKGYTVSSTFSLKYLLSLDHKTSETTGNLLSMFMRDIESAIYGENRYTAPSSKDIEAKTIKTMKEWKSFYNEMITKPVVSIDTETENLNRKYDNRILTIHFAIDDKVGWCLPLYHRQTTFKSSEIDEIKKDLAWYFQFGESKFHIYHTAKFDLAQFMRDLGINYNKHDVFDISAGEFLLDENRKFIADAKATASNKGVYSLEHLAYYYGSIAYMEGDVSKADRARMAELELEDIAKYGAKDVIVPFHIAKFQLAEAKRRGENYKGFRLAATKLCSDTIHVMADMEYNGSLVDLEYIRAMLMPKSKFMERIDELRRSFKDFRSVKRANKKIIENGSKNYKTGLFGDIEDNWMFNIDKQDHLQILFFEILQLKVLDYRKDKGAKLDKTFVAEYEGAVPEVSRLSEYRKLKALKNTFIIGILKILLESPDCKDNRIRANYNFLFILTLRSSAQHPNLQAIPSRGKNAKLVKRQFVCSRGKIQLKGDYNAHEVRGWGNISKDKGIAQAFEPGIKLRRQLRLLFNKDPELQQALFEHLDQVGWADIKDPKAKLKLAEKSNFKQEMRTLVSLESDGDVHKKNYELFFNVPAMEVSDLQRQSVKEVVFGVLYGKAAQGLAKSIYKKELRAIEEKYGHNPDLVEDKSLVYYNMANEIIKKMFKRFSEGKSWIDEQNETGKQSLENVSNFGAVRHLSGYLHTDTSIISRMNRRGPNSMVQGPSSNIGYTGARELQHTNFVLKQNKIDTGWIHCNFVHDSLEGEADIDMLPLSIYYLEHSMTTLVYRKCRDLYKWDMPIQMEFDMEIGATLANMYKFDYTKNTLIKSVSKSIDLMNEELKYDLPKNKYLKAISHNWDLVWKYRCKELEQMKGYASSDVMLLTPKIAKDLPWKRVVL